jgi:hypothetical protein
MNANYMGFVLAPSTPEALPVRINLDRMQTALNTETFVAPEGLNREQLRKFIIDSGKK